jgi:hypothetical protein
VVISFRKRTFPQHFLGRLLYRERNADTGLGHTWEPLNLVVGTESQAEEANGRKRQQAVPYSTKVNSFFIIGNDFPIKHETQRLLVDPVIRRTSS